MLQTVVVYQLHHRHIPAGQRNYDVVGESLRRALVQDSAITPSDVALPLFSTHQLLHKTFCAFLCNKSSSTGGMW